MLSRALLGILVALVSLSAVTVLLAYGEQVSQKGNSGFRAIHGSSANVFSVADDMELVKTLRLSEYGFTYERYQQFYGKAHAQVMGGQISRYRDESGEITLVLGNHYPDIRPSNSVRRTNGNARDDAEKDVGKGDTAKINLMINPLNGKYFHSVEISRFDSRWVRWTDASTGALLNKYNAIAEACPPSLPSNSGCGVNGDVKDMAGITNLHNAESHGGGNPHWDMSSGANYGGRQSTYDYGNKDPFLYYVTDPNNVWDVVTSNRQSPGHPALVDAQYHAGVTDQYFQNNFGFNWLDCYPGGMQSVAHYNRNYNNAFWNGTYTVYGDGDNGVFRELSGGLDVVSHEHTHGLTECTSGLTYQNEAGALNESFSDMLGNGAEYYASDSPDWLIGEEIYVPNDTALGFRNMASPAEDGDPDHYSERYTGTEDNGGVHTNSGIPNHAYFLLVNGGSNAGEALGHSHSGPVVTGIGLADAEQIFFLAFIGLPANATMAQARTATIASAETLFGSGSPQANSSSDAWDAVGVGAASPPPPTPTPTPTPTPEPPPTPTPTPDPTGFVLDANGYKVKATQHVDLSWSGTGSSVDILRDGVVMQGSVSGSTYTDNIGKKGGGDTYSYQVCEAGGRSTCSNTVNVVF